MNRKQKAAFKKKAKKVVQGSNADLIRVFNRALDLLDKKLQLDREKFDREISSFPLAAKLDEKY